MSPAGTAMIAAVATALEEGQVPDPGTAAAMALGEVGGVRAVKARATLEASLGVAVKQFRRLPEGRQTFPHSIEVNNEPYFGGEWRKRPYERKAYERIESTSRREPPRTRGPWRASSGRGRVAGATGAVASATTSKSTSSSAAGSRPTTHAFLGTPSATRRALATRRYAQTAGCTAAPSSTTARTSRSGSV